MSPLTPDELAWERELVADARIVALRPSWVAPRHTGPAPSPYAQPAPRRRWRR